MDRCGCGGGCCCVGGIIGLLLTDCPPAPPLLLIPELELLLRPSLPFSLGVDAPAILGGG